MLYERNWCRIWWWAIPLSGALNSNNVNPVCSFGDCRYVFDIAILGEHGSWVFENRRVFTHCDKGISRWNQIWFFRKCLFQLWRWCNCISRMEINTNEKRGIHLDGWLGRLLDSESWGARILFLACLEHYPYSWRLGSIVWICSRRDTKIGHWIQTWSSSCFCDVCMCNICEMVWWTSSYPFRLQTSPMEKRNPWRADSGRMEIHNTSSQAWIPCS